ncbi:hypothetical protein F2P79_022541, partial [Pimephales promelas]
QQTRSLQRGSFTAKQTGEHTVDCQINTLNGLKYNNVSLFLCSQNVMGKLR